MSQKVKYEVRVTVSQEPLMDDHDVAVVAVAIEDAVTELEWEGVEVQVVPL